MLHPFKFRPHLKSVLWGGDKIVRFKGLKTRQRMIGESWEISGVEGRESIVAGGPDAGRSLVELIARYKWSLVGEEVYRRFGSTFPLLVKFIDARQDLSVQVHPGDELARRRHNAMGKTEMWYVIDADAGARIGCGLSQPITTEDYERRVADKSIMDVVALHESHRGDVFYIPSGRIRATSPTASMTMTAATLWEIPVSCTRSWPVRPSTSMWPMITASTMVRKTLPAVSG